MADLPKVFQEIVGPGGVIDGRGLEPYAVDGLLPRVVIFPDSREQLATAVASAAWRDLAVAARGGGTMIDLGAPPARIDIIACTSRLNRVLAYSPADLTITVEAGITIAELQKVLCAEGQCLPIDPPLRELATVGGVIATNASGPWRHSGGTMRDLILGIEVIGQEGRRIKSGGRVVKNVTGYDLCKLMVGSLGTLGIISSVTLKVSPLPKASATLLLPFPTFADGARALSRFDAPPLEPLALDVLDVSCVSRLEQQLLRQPAPVVAVALGGSEAAVARQVADVATLQRELSGAPPIQLTGRTEAQFWQTVRDFPARASLSVRIAGLPSQIRGASGSLSAMGSKGGIGTLIRAGGRAVLVFSWPESIPADTQVSLDAMSEVRAMADKLEAVMLVERCPPALRAVLHVRGLPGPPQAIMQRIKRRLDPKDTFNPGRFGNGVL